MLAALGGNLVLQAAAGALQAAQLVAELADLLTCNLCWPFFQKLEADLADLPAFKRCCMAKQAAQLVTELA